MLEHVKSRVYAMLDELRSVDGDILIVTHGGVCLVFLSYFKGPPEDGCYTSYELPHGKALMVDYKDKVKSR